MTHRVLPGDTLHLARRLALQCNSILPQNQCLLLSREATYKHTHQKLSLNQITNKIMHATNINYGKADTKYTNRLQYSQRLVQHLTKIREEKKWNEG